MSAELLVMPPLEGIPYRDALPAFWTWRSTSGEAAHSARYAGSIH